MNENSDRKANKKTKKKNELFNINFGINVLTWLKYDEKATFNDLNDEILNNKHSNK